jgi:crotonobetainyl-CoA:carnitine CoA-transferase CaiB-like acyl-CoA transferase
MDALSGYTVLDLTGETGALCVQLLAGMGTSGIRVDIAETAARGRLFKLAKTADVLIETFPPGYLSSFGLGYHNLSGTNPRLVMASITPFGQDGLYKDLKASDLTLQALGGWMSVTGGPDAPLKLYGPQAYHAASLFAANGILLALLGRHATGRGQYLDIAVFECVAAALDHVLPRYFYQGVVSRREGSLHWNHAFRVFKCRDGYALLSLHAYWDTLVEWLASEGLAADLAAKKYLSRAGRDRHIGHIIEVLEKWALTHSAGELVEKGQLMHFPWAEVKDAW